MRAYSPTGSPITGTFERVSGVSTIHQDSFQMAETGRFDFDYAGETNIDWNSQQTVERGGGRVFVDETDAEWTEDRLILLDDDEEPVDLSGWRVHHDAGGFYALAVAEVEKEERTGVSVGLDPRPHFPTAQAVWRALRADVLAEEDAAALESPPMLPAAPDAPALRNMVVRLVATFADTCDQHIWDKESDGPHPADCPYCEAIAEARKILDASAS